MTGLPAPSAAGWLKTLVAGDRVIRDRAGVLVAPATHIVAEPARDGQPPRTRCGWDVDGSYSSDLIGKGSPCVACNRRGQR